MKKDMLRDITEFLPNTDEYTISLVGLNKNSGKTETLIYILKRLYKENINVAVTSIGFDGEKIDMIFNHKKPQFIVPKGTFIATAEQAVNNIKGEFSILEDVEEYGPLGKIYIIKAISSLSTELVGPSSIDGLKKVCQVLKKYCKRIFIDGAYNRIAQASPKLVDYLILSIGGTSLEFLKDRIEKLNLLRQIPLYEKRDLNEFIFKDKHFLINEKIDQINDIEKIDNHSTIIYNGALSEKVAQKVNKKNIRIIISDISKIFLKRTSLNKLLRKNLLFVYYKEELLLVTYNPINFYGNNYDSKQFGKEISNLIERVECCDVISSYCYKGGKISGLLK